MTCKDKASYGSSPSCTSYMGWLRSVGSIKLYVSFAEYRLFRRALLQKRPIILYILLSEATPYKHYTHYACMSQSSVSFACTCVCGCVCVGACVCECGMPYSCERHCNTLQHTATHCNTLQHTLQVRVWYDLFMWETWRIYSDIKSSRRSQHSHSGNCLSQPRAHNT